ncbi:MAG: hypothetical protein FJ214_09560 [Ignavibacteria bacterium]|nr:hypothetical protein [Ignavibacteria bacterium]
MKKIFFLFVISTCSIICQVNQTKLELFLNDLPLPKFSLTYEELKNRNAVSYQDENSLYSKKLEELEALREDVENDSENSNRRGSPQATIIMAKRNASGDVIKYVQLSDAFSKRIIGITEQLHRTNQKIIDDGKRKINQCGEIGEGTKNVNSIVECTKKAARDRDNIAVDTTNSILKKINKEFDDYISSIKKYYKVLIEESNSITRLDRNAQYEHNWYNKQLIETADGVLKVIANLHELRESTITAFNSL